MKHSNSELKSIIGSGLLAFPVTCFTSAGEFDEQAYRESIDVNVESGAVALFAPGGTGEFFSLGAGEYEQVVRAAARQAAGRLPILGGAGYGVRQAVELAHSAEAAGADGLLLFPPYLMKCEQGGLFDYVSAVCSATSLGVVVYNRDNAIYSIDTILRLCEKHPNFIGFKDGHGDLEQLTTLRAQVGDRLSYIGGMPTAEVFAASYMAMGFSTYSSAIYNFVPDFAMHFFRAIHNGNSGFVESALREFFQPYLMLRNRRRGYAVSIVKAGMRITSRDPGPVRAPLTDLTEAETQELRELIGRVPALMAA